MLKNTRVLGAVVICAVAGLLLGGCTSGPQAAPTAAPTVVAAPTTVASPSAPSVESEPAPSPTVERNRDTAKQFIIDYFEAYEEGLRTGSPEPVARFSSGNCKKCAAVATELEKLLTERKRWPTATSSAIPYASKESEDPDVLHWEVDYSVDQGDEIDREGAVTASAGPERVIMFVTLKHDGARWLIDGMAAGATINER